MSAGGNARKADTPWRGRPISGSRGAGTNAKRQAEARKQLDRCELDLGLGKTSEWCREFHAEQRRRVLARYGIAA